MKRMNEVKEVKARFFSPRNFLHFYGLLFTFTFVPILFVFLLIHFYCHLLTFYSFQFTFLHLDLSFCLLILGGSLVILSSYLPGFLPLYLCATSLSCRPNFIYSILILGDTTYASRIYILQHWIKHIVAFYLCLKELSSYLHSTTTAAYFLVK